MNGKVVVITGTTHGVGKAAAIKLAAMGATIIMGCRNMQLGWDVKQEIQTGCPTAQLEVKYIDLSILASVKTFADGVIDNYDKVDVLINNAATVQGDFGLSVDGHEVTFAVNHLGPYLLTHLLLPLLTASAPARVVIVGSTAYETVNSFDTERLNDPTYFSSFATYARSKYANCLFGMRLAEELKPRQINVYIVHPGVVDSNLGRDAARECCCMVICILRCLSCCMRSPLNAAISTVRCATDETIANETGRFYTELGNMVPWSSKIQESSDELIPRLEAYCFQAVSNWL